MVMHRSLSAIGATALALVATTPGCSGKVTQAGGLELIISSDMATPASFDTVHVDIEQEAPDGGWRQPPLLGQYYVIPSQMTLPTTIAIVAGSSADQEVLITVTGLRGGLAGQDIVQRVIQTQVPSDRLAELPIVLAAVCAGKLDCPVGDSCQPASQGNAVAGNCGANEVIETELPAYRVGDVTEAGVPSALDSSGPTSSMVVDDAGDATTLTMPPVPEAGEASPSESPGEGGSGEGAANEVPEATTGAPDAGAPPPPADAGTDAPACTDACTLAQTQCSSGAVQTCQLQASGCTQWVTTSTCGAHQTCVFTSGSASCTCEASVCTQVGMACQDAQTLTTCASDADGCLYVASSAGCSSPMSCSGMAPNAGCSLSCASSCMSGQKSCGTGGLATCTLGTNGCWAYAPPVACGSHQTCTGAAGAGTCTCTTDPVCSAAGNTCTSTSASATCSTDAQGCIYQTASATCVNQTCVGGTCSGVCGPGQHTCAADGTGLEACSTSGGWGPEVPCTYACVGNACGGVCVPGATACGAGNSSETCDGTGQWGTLTACQVATPACNAGHCAYDLPSAAPLPNTTTQYIDYIYAVKVTPTATTRVARVGFVGAGTTGTLTFGVYSDSAGLPNTLLGSSGFLADANGAVEGTIAPAVTMTAQTSYWIVGLSDSSVYINANNSSGAGYVFGSYAAYPTLPTTFPRSGSSDVPMTALNYYLVVQDQ
jgi:hypothetical protein